MLTCTGFQIKFSLEHFMAISFLSGFVEEAQKQVKLEYSGLADFSHRLQCHSSK